MISSPQCVVSGYPNNSPSEQLAPDNLPQIFRQLAPCSFIHYQAKQAAKVWTQDLHHTNYFAFFYPLLSLKIGGELSGANCPGVSCLGLIVQAASCLGLIVQGVNCLTLIVQGSSYLGLIVQGASCLTFSLSNPMFKNIVSFTQWNSKQKNINKLLRVHSAAFGHRL